MGHSLAFTEKNIAPLLEDYTETAQFILEELNAGHSEYLRAVLNHLDFFGRFLLRTILGLRLDYRCPAGRSSFGVSTDGALYPCASFCDIPDFRLGHVSTGIEEARVRKLSGTSRRSEAGVRGMLGAAPVRRRLRLCCLCNKWIGIGARSGKVPFDQASLSTQSLAVGRTGRPGTAPSPRDEAVCPRGDTAAQGKSADASTLASSRILQCRVRK